MEIDETWLTLYIHLNRELCLNLGEIETPLLVRKKGRWGKDAGMGSEECSQRERHVNSESSNWEFPKIMIGRKDRRS